jgi:tetratricopeptide (TPR) repeat protein
MRCLVALVLVLIAPAARAQLDVEAAKAHYAAGSADFDAGRYADALVEFEKAYRLSGRGALLYNIGVCHERLGHAQLAIDSFQRYLAVAEDADRPSVESRIARLRESQRPKPPPSRDRASTLTTTPSSSGERPVYKRGWFWGVVGGAAAVVVVGVTVGVVVGTRDSTRFLPDVRPQ